MLKLLCAFVLGLFLGIHRRVIRAVITGSPMPKAPASHFWVKNKETD